MTSHAKPDLRNGNLVLIGMPGCGKSTVGVVLAKRLGRNFVDTDLLIQVAQRQTLQEIVDAEGFAGFCQIEEQALLDLEVSEHIIATGGSVVYGEEGMQHLQNLGTIVFLKASLATLQPRLTNAATRGIALKPGQTLAELYEERNQLYPMWAEFTVVCDGLTPEEVCQRVEAVVGA